MRLAVSLALALGASAVATGLVLGACSSDDFATPDGGTDATPDTVATDGGTPDSGDAGIDARPKTWCQTNAADAFACADFDTTDAAASVPGWTVDQLGNATFGIVAAPTAGSADANASAPNQLSAWAGAFDGGGDPPIAQFGTLPKPPATASVLTLEFSFLPPSTSGLATQVVEFASLNVSATSSIADIGVALIHEGSAWQFRALAPGPATLPIIGGIAPGVWHRIRLVLDKGPPATYQTYIDGKVVFTNPVTWPPTVKGASCQIGALQLGTIDTAEQAYFDNVVCQAQ